MAVTTKELACGLIPERLFAGLCARRGAFFLDSARVGAGLGRWSFIGFEPFLEFRETEAEGVTITEGGRTTRRGGEDPLEALRECLRRFAASGHEEIPFCGGAVGYLSYELCTLLERIERKAADDLGLPRILLGFHDGVIAHDQATGRTFAVANPVHERGADEILAGLETAVGEALRAQIPEPAGGATAEPVSNLTSAEYLEGVQRVREYIAAGDVYQINLTQRFSAPFVGEPYALYRRLRAASPAAMAAYLNCGDFQVLSASPELLLRIDGREVETRPIKGTRPRGATPAEDERLCAELLASEKDRAELLMIVDLERNDLGRVCAAGSVRVEELCRLETLPTVHHLVATVRGRLRAECDALDAVRATFPGGSITGAPKIRAMQIIDELETVRRHVYTGAIGWLGFDGDCDLNIAIRTMLCRAGVAYYHVGGGVVWDSEPEAELQETLDKGRAMRAALMEKTTMAIPGYHRYALRGDELLESSALSVSALGDGLMFGLGVYETIRVLDGRPVFLDRHAARLARGAAQLGLELPTSLDEWRERLARLAQANRLGDGVIKLMRFGDVGGVREVAVSRDSGYRTEHYERGFRVHLVPTARAGAVHEMKSLAYLEKLLARRAAQRAGYDDAVFVDPAGNLLEGAGSNLFAVVGGKLLTPPAHNILPGVARSVVLECAAGGVEGVVLTPRMLEAATEVFLTNAVMGLMPVAELGGRRFDVARAPVTRAIAAEFARRQRASVDG